MTLMKTASETAILDAPAKQQCASSSILIVDDDVQMRRLIAAFAKRAGYEVFTAENGKEALAMAWEKHPNLILLDCQMPDMSGFEVCEKLREDFRFDDTPILFVTSFDSPRERVRGFDVGGVDFITKPVEEAELLARIGTHIELARSRRQLRRQAKLLEGVVESQSGRLEQVRTGQASMLVDPSTIEGIKAAVRFQPAAEAGGDFYDIIRLDDDQHAFFVADVSGHDLGVAYLTGAMKALITSFSNEVLSVQETTIMLNTSLWKFLDSGRYVTGNYAKFSREAMRVDIIGAGHPAPLLQRRGGEIEFFDLIGDVLGMFDTVRCEAASIAVKPGDRLFLYTDGLIESYLDSSGVDGSRRVGAERFSESIAGTRGQELQTVVDNVIGELITECGGAIGDDVVLLGIEF